MKGRTKNNTKIQSYNSALFNNMTFLADAVWDIYPKEDVIYIMHDKLTPELTGETVTFNQMKAFLKRHVYSEVSEQLIPLISQEFVSNLKENYSFKTVIKVQGKYHQLQCFLTPSFNSKNEITNAYLSIQDIQYQLDQKEQVEESKKELNRYLSAVPCGILQYTKDTNKIVFANDNALKILGYNSIDEMQNDDFDGIAKTVLPEDATYMRNLLDSLTSERDCLSCEYRIKHKDGKIIICFGNIRLLTQENDEPIIQRSIIDITEREKTGNLYRELSEVFDGARMGLWYFIFDEGKPKIFPDKQTINFIGCDSDSSPEEAFEFWVNHIDEAYKEELRAHEKKMRSGKYSEISYPYHHPTRGKIYIRCGGCINRSYTGKGLMVRGYYQDITEYQNRLSTEIEKEKAERETLQGIASVYSTMHILDFENNSVEERTAISPVHNYVIAHTHENLQDIMWGVMKTRFSGSACESILKFTDFSTLQKRLGEKNSIYIELLDIENLWYRISFIRIGKKEESLKKILFVSENIDAEKRKEENLILVSNTDELTQLYNRHAYENDIIEIEEKGIDNNLWFMGVDLNGLKTANDSKGHKAGDELLRATADCLSKAISVSGKVYRVGGDEFICIFHADDKETTEIIKYMEYLRNEWHGDYNESFSFSKGLVRANEIPECTIAKLEKESDIRMYAEKRNYYMSRGDRRQR